MDDDLYAEREATLVKHTVLRTYLERFAHIIGWHWDSITYVDCFSGPWKSRSDKLVDTSVSIALEELRKARGHLLEAKRRDVHLRAFFVERNPDAFQRLCEFTAQFGDIEIEVRNTEFENTIEEICRFVAIDKKTFPFIFIDPTGWTGFSMNALSPLLSLDPVEVLVNFMTKDIRRFIEYRDEGNQESLEALFGTREYLDIVRDVTDPLEREELLVGLYKRQLRTHAAFAHVSAAIVLNPEKDATHFHLIYGTRHPTGLEVFKKAERTAMEAQESRRLQIKDKKTDRHKQTDFLDLGSLEKPETSHYSRLRSRYTDAARGAIKTKIENEASVSYDDLWSVASEFSLTWESDLKVWIAEMARGGVVRIEGLSGGERTLKRGKRHMIVRTD